METQEKYGKKKEEKRGKKRKEEKIGKRGKVEKVAKMKKRGETYNKEGKVVISGKIIRGRFEKENV